MINGTSRMNELVTIRLCQYISTLKAHSISREKKNLETVRKISKRLYRKKISYANGFIARATIQ